MYNVIDTHHRADDSPSLFWLDCRWHSEQFVPSARCITHHAFVVWTPPPMQAFWCARSCLCPTEISVRCWYLGDQRFDNSLAEIYSCNVELNAISGPPPSVTTVRPWTSKHRRQTFINVGSSTSTHRCAMSSNTLRLYQQYQAQLPTQAWEKALPHSNTR